MISDSIELYETEVWFLHIQLIGTTVSFPKTLNVPSRFWVLKISRASLFTDHDRTSDRPIRVKYNHLEQFEMIFDNSPEKYLFLLFEVTIIDAWSWYFIELMSRHVR